jgi:hypothetical protein
MRIRPILLSSLALAVAGQLALPSDASAQLGLLKRAKEKAKEIAIKKAMEQVAGKPDSITTANGAIANALPTTITNETIDQLIAELRGGSTQPGGDDVQRRIQLSTYWVTRDGFVANATLYASCGGAALRRHGFGSESAERAHDHAMRSLMERGMRLAPTNPSVQSAMAPSAEALKLSDSLDVLQYDFALRVTGNDGRLVPDDVRRKCGAPPSAPAIPAGLAAPRRSQLYGQAQAGGGASLAGIRQRVAAFLEHGLNAPSQSFTDAELGVLMRRAADLKPFLQQLKSQG